MQIQELVLERDNRRKQEREAKREQLEHARQPIERRKLQITEVDGSDSDSDDGKQEEVQVEEDEAEEKEQQQQQQQQEQRELQQSAVTVSMHSESAQSTPTVASSTSLTTDTTGTSSPTPSTARCTEAKGMTRPLIQVIDDDEDAKVQSDIKHVDAIASSDRAHRRGISPASSTASARSSSSLPS